MDSGNLDIENILDKVFNLEHEMLYADIAALSNLDDENFLKFKTAWSKSDYEQRLNIISKMVSASEDDFTLDFTRIFLTGFYDTNEAIRIKAIEGLELEDKYTYARPILTALKSDESEEVRAVAAKALGKFTRMIECDEVPEILASKVYNALLETLENEREPMSVRRRALESISPFRQELIQQYIEDYYYHDDLKVKASAIFAMGANCDTRWLEFLIAEMQSEIAELRYEAARSSGGIADEEAVPYLIKLVEDIDPEVQDAAINSLGQIGGQEAKKLLQKLSRSTNARIKDTAKAALSELESCEDPLSLNF
jgi:HEAT repeat protein